MTRILHISLMVLMVPLVLLAAACRGGHDEPQPPVPGGPVPEYVEAGFTITLPTLAGAGTDGPSRAPGHGDDRYDTGAGYENYINIAASDFRFYFFDATNTYLATLDVTSLLPLAQTPGSKTYEVRGSVPGTLVGKAVKVVAVANWGSYPERPASIDALASQLYDFGPDAMRLSQDHTIPLYGVTDLFPALDFNSLDFADLGTIHLLRAYAKITVASSAPDQVQVEGVTLSKYNTRGYCAPWQIYAQSDYVHAGDYIRDYVNTPHIPAGAESTVELPFMLDADNVATAYIPEMLIKGRTAADRPVMAVRFSGYERAYALEFKYYNSTDADPYFNVLRNYWFAYKVRPNRGTLDVIVDVLPYIPIELDPIFGLGRDEDGNATFAVVYKDAKGKVERIEYYATFDPKHNYIRLDKVEYLAGPYKGETWDYSYTFSGEYTGLVDLTTPGGILHQVAQYVDDEILVYEDAINTVVRKHDKYGTWWYYRLDGSAWKRQASDGSILYFDLEGLPTNTAVEPYPAQ